MQVQIDRDGSLIIKLQPSETENIHQALMDNFTQDVCASLRNVCDSKFRRWEAASSLDKESVILPSRFVDMTQLMGRNTEPDEPEINFQSATTWKCHICGAPNTVSRDDGCTNCNH